MPNFAKFEVELTPIGRGGKVIVNGEDVSNQTSGVAVFSKVGEVTTLQVMTYAEGVVKGEGVVEVYVDNQRGLSEWLRQVNRSKVDELALARGGWGSDATLTDNVIEVLLEMLDAPEPSPNS